MGLTHLIKRRDFKAAAATGRRYRCKPCTVQLRQREPETLLIDGAAPSGLRLGLTATRHTGTATERNRMRRRLRAAADIVYAASAAQPLDVVIIARREALTTPFADLSSDLARALTLARPYSPAAPRQRPAP